MLLQRLEIRNMRKIKQAEIEFHGAGVQVIQGLNKSGKTTIAQSIALTFGGTKELVPGTITHGEESAEIIAYTNTGLKIRTVVKDGAKQEVSRLNDAGRYTKVSGGVRAFLDSLRSGLEAPYTMKDWTDAAVIELLKERIGHKSVEIKNGWERPPPYRKRNTENPSMHCKKKKKRQCNFYTPLPVHLRALKKTSMR